MSSLVHFRECAKAIALFVSSFGADFALLKFGKRWFQALDFSVSCTVVNFFFCCRTRRSSILVRQFLRFWVPPARSTGNKNTLDDSTRNQKFKRLEQHFQTSSTRSAPIEDTKSANDLAHSLECTKGLISALPDLFSMETFGARAEKRNALRKKIRRPT